ncbi:hypothetical protein GCM10007905_29690 [Mixta theicola]|nr:hypothetical protein GCM10007905_29690 [Mixta theicola]
MIFIKYLMGYFKASISEGGRIVTSSSTTWFLNMQFPERLTTLRKARGLTQQMLADMAGVAVLQIRRYEGGNSQPTLDVIRRLAIALGVSADMLVFDEQERGPDEQLRYQFETISRMPQYEQDVIRELLDAMIIKNQVTGAIARVAQGAAKEES